MKLLKYSAISVLILGVAQAAALSYSSSDESSSPGAADEQLSHPMYPTDTPIFEPPPQYLIQTEISFDLPPESGLVSSEEETEQNLKNRAQQYVRFGLAGLPGIIVQGRSNRAHVPLATNLVQSEESFSGNLASVLAGENGNNPSTDGATAIFASAAPIVPLVAAPEPSTWRFVAGGILLLVIGRLSRSAKR